MKQFLSLVFVLLGFASYAQKFEVEGVIYNILNNEYVEVSSINEESINTGLCVDKAQSKDNTTELLTITIPDKVNFEGKNYIVSGIGNRAFAFIRSIGEINLPETVIYIGSDAFRGSSLQSISLSSALTSIGEDAFRETEILEITIPKSLQQLGNYAFCECIKLVSVNFEAESSLKTIPQYCFAGSQIKEIDLPSSVTVIEDYAFYGSNVTVLNSESKIRSLGAYSFAGSQIRDFNCVVSETIGDYAFTACPNLVQFTVMANNIGSSVFERSSLMLLRLENEKTTVNGVDKCLGKHWSSQIVKISVPNDNKEAYRKEYPDFLKDYISFTFDSDKYDTLLMSVYDTTDIEDYVEVSKDNTIFSYKDHRMSFAWKNETDLEVVFDSAIIDDSELNKVESSENGTIDIFRTPIMTKDATLFIGSKGAKVEGILSSSNQESVVYGLDGTIVANNVDESTLATLPKGVYVVRCGMKTYKVAI